MGEKLENSTEIGRGLEVIEELPIHIEDRVYMCLAYLGLIPAWEVRFQAPLYTPRIDEVEIKLKSIGFYTRRVLNNLQDLEINYSLSLEYVEELCKLKCLPRSYHTDLRIGELYGIPKSARESYSAQSARCVLLPPEVTCQEYMYLAQFVLSDNWEEELKTSQTWVEALKQNVPFLWQEYVKWKKSRGA